MARSCHRLRAVTVTGSGHTVQALPIDRTVEILKKYGAITTRATFDRASLTLVDFGDQNLTRLSLKGLSLVRCVFAGADMQGVGSATADGLGPRCGGVIQIEEDTTDAELDAFGEIGVRAVRLDLFARAQWPTGEIIAYIRRMAARVTPRGWHLQFYTPGTVVRDLLPFLADLEDTFVIDHMGYLTESDPDLERRLLAVLAQGSCWIKLSGAYRVAKDKPPSSVAPWGQALVTARPDRLIWGSDWPHLPDGQRDTGEILNLLPDWAPTEKDRQAILVDGPARLFFA